MTFKINILNLAVLVLAVVLISCVSALGSVTTEPAKQTTLIGFIGDYWAQIGLVISEACAFLPKKFSGIAKTVVSFLGYLFAKKK